MPGLEPDAHLENRRCAPPLDRNEPFLGNRIVLVTGRRRAASPFGCRAEGSAKKGFRRKKIIGKPNVSSSRVSSKGYSALALTFMDPGLTHAL